MVQAQKGVSEPRSSGQAALAGPAGPKQDTAQAPDGSLPGPPPMKRMPLLASSTATAATSPSSSVKGSSRPSMTSPLHQPLDPVPLRFPQPSDAAAGQVSTVPATEVSQGRMKPSPVRRPSQFSASPPDTSPPPPSAVALHQIVPSHPQLTGSGSNVRHTLHPAGSRDFDTSPTSSDTRKQQSPARLSREEVSAASTLVGEQQMDSSTPLTPPTLAKGIAPGALADVSPASYPGPPASEPLAAQDSDTNGHVKDGNTTFAGKRVLPDAEKAREVLSPRPSNELKNSLLHQPSDLGSKLAAVPEQQPANAPLEAETLNLGTAFDVGTDQPLQSLSASVLAAAAQSDIALSAGLPSLPDKLMALPIANATNGELPLPGASAEQAAPTEAAPKRKRLGWGQGLKRRESHPVLAQVGLLPCSLCREKQ